MSKSRGRHERCETSLMWVIVWDKTQERLLSAGNSQNKGEVVTSQGVPNMKRLEYWAPWREIKAADETPDSAGHSH